MSRLAAGAVEGYGDCLVSSHGTICDVRAPVLAACYDPARHWPTVYQWTHRRGPMSRAHVRSASNVTRSLSCGGPRALMEDTRTAASIRTTIARAL